MGISKEGFVIWIIFILFNNVIRVVPKDWVRKTFKAKPLALKRKEASTGLMYELTTGQTSAAALWKIKLYNWRKFLFCHMSYIFELVKKSYFKDRKAIYTPIVFQNKMNLTSTLRERAVTRVMSEGKNWKSECVPISPQCRHTLNKRLNKLSSQLLRDLLLHAHPLITMDFLHFSSLR